MQGRGPSVKVVSRPGSSCSRDAPSHRATYALTYCLRRLKCSDAACQQLHDSTGSYFLRGTPQPVRGRVNDTVQVQDRLSASFPCQWPGPDVLVAP